MRALASKENFASRTNLNVIESPEARVAVLIAVSLVIRCVFAASTGLGVDEAYLVATSRHLALSTYDHPPMAWWIGWLASHVLGSESAFAIRLPFVLLFAATTWQMFRLGERLFGAEAGFWSALALNCSPVLGITSATWAVPDAPLMLFMLAGANSLVEVLFEKNARPWLWLVAGFWGGLAMLSKYHGIFLFAGTGVFLLTSPSHRRWLFTPWPYVATIVAAIIFAPVVIWNIQNHWASFAFQGGRANAGHARLWMPFVALVAQAIFIAPTNWLGLAYVVTRDMFARPCDAKHRFLLCIGLGPIIFFTLVSVWSQGMFFHWAAPGYLMLTPLLGQELARRFEKRDRLWRGAALATACAAPVLVLAFSALFVATEFDQLIPGADPFFDMREWSALRSELDLSALRGSGVTFIAGVRWHQVGRIDYGLKQALPVTCLCEDARGYGVIAPARMFVGQTGVVLVSLKKVAQYQSELRKQFKTLERLPDVKLFETAYGAVSMAAFLGVDLLQAPIDFGRTPGRAP